MAAVFVLTLVWNLVLRLYVFPTQFVKTEVRVVDLNSSAPTIKGGGRQVNSFPTYEYTAIDGTTKTLVSNDGFNRFNGFLFEKHKGQLVTAYLEKSNADSEPFITKTGDWFIFLAAPLIFAILPFGPIYAIILYFVNKRHKTRISH